MKKSVNRALAILLALLIPISLIPVVTAEDTGESPGWMDKLDPQVLEHMETLSEEETIPVWIWFTAYDHDEFERRLKQESGYTDSEMDAARREINSKYAPGKRELFEKLNNDQLAEDEKAALREELLALSGQESEEHDALYLPFQKIRNRIMDEMGTAHITAIMKALGIDGETVPFFDPDVCTAVADLPKSKVFPAAMSPDVTYIYYFDKTIPTVDPLEPPTEDASIADRLAYYVRENYAVSYQGETVYVPEISSYEELYTHKDGEGETDWVLINAEIGSPEPWMGFGLIGNRVRLMGPLEVFAFGMALYDAREHTFYDLSKMDDYRLYDGLAEAIDACGKGRLLGDLDQDDVISVIDVTIIQRCEASLMTYPDSDRISEYEYIDSTFRPLAYYADFNRDGSRDILDATCIQRYLTGADYKKYR